MSLLVLAGCLSERETPWAGTVELDGATTVVQSPASPLIPDSLVRVARVWVLSGENPQATMTSPPPSAPGSQAGADTTAAASQWAEAHGLVVVGNSAFFLDRQNTRLHKVGLDGRWRGSFGRSGSGPSELRRPSVLTAVGDTLVVLDSGDPSLELFDTSGVHRRQIRLDGGIPFGVHALGADAMLLNRFDGRRAAWLRISLDGVERPFPMPGEDALAEPATRVCRHTSTAGASVLRVDCALPRLAVIDSAGTELLRFSIPRDSARVSGEELATYRSQMVETMTKSGMPANAATVNADRFLKDMQVREPFRIARRDSASGNYGIWEQGSRDLQGEEDDPAILHLFSSGGVYLARISFPAPWRDFAFVDGGVLTLSVEAETGLVSVERYRISLPADATERASRLAAASRGPE